MSDTKETNVEGTFRLRQVNPDDLRDEAWNRVTRSFQVSQGSFRGQTVVGGGVCRSKETGYLDRTGCLHAPLQEILAWEWTSHGLPFERTRGGDVQSDESAETEFGGIITRVLAQLDESLLQDITEAYVPGFLGGFEKRLRNRIAKARRSSEDDDTLVVYPKVAKDIEHREYFSFDEPEIPASNRKKFLEELLSSEVSHERRRKLIIEIEAVQIPDSDIERILPLLREFIEQHRNSNDPSDAVAVTSAIRTYIADLPVGRTGELVYFLETGHRVSVPIDVELEIAKMIYRKFEANPPDKPDPEPDLAKRLDERARSYLNPHVFPRDRYFAAVAMNACQAIAAMRSELTANLFSFVRESSAEWFTQQLVRRLEKQLAERWAGNDELVQWLDARIQILKQTPSKEIGNVC